MLLDRAVDTHFEPSTRRDVCHSMNAGYFSYLASGHIERIRQEVTSVSGVDHPAEGKVAPLACFGYLFGILAHKNVSSCQIGKPWQNNMTALKSTGVKR